MELQNTEEIHIRLEYEDQYENQYEYENHLLVAEPQAVEPLQVDEAITAIERIDTPGPPWQIVPGGQLFPNNCRIGNVPIPPPVLSLSADAFCGFFRTGHRIIRQGRTLTKAKGLRESGASEVYRFIVTTTAATSIEEVCRAAISCVERSLGADRASIELTGFLSEFPVSESQLSPRSGPTPPVSQPLFISDINESGVLTSRLSALRRKGARAVGIIPLLWQGQHLGSLEFYSRTPGHFLDQEVLLVRSVVGHLSAALAGFHAQQKASSFRCSSAELSKSQHRMQRLQELTTALSQEPGTHQIYQILVQQCVAAVGANSGGLFVATEGGARLEFVAQDSSLPLNISLPATDCYEQKKLILLESRAALHEQYPDVAVSDSQDWGEALACVPVSTTGVCHGVLVFCFEKARSFSDADQAFFMNLARQGALALERSHFYEEAQRNIRSREELMAIIAHDLRAPLTVSSLIAYQLLEHNPDSPEATNSSSYADLLLGNNEQMERLIRDMLSFSAIESGRLDVTPQHYDLGDILERVVETARLGRNAQPIELLHPDSSIQVLCDRDRLVQIMVNLIANARKYTDPSGQISVCYEERSGEARIAVKDTGVGIAPEVLPQIFDRFWTGGRRGEARSYGLGLFIVKGLVQAQGGRVWAESSPGQGSTFFFTLPLAEAEQAEAPRFSRKVLFVDDDNAFRREVAEILSEQGLDVVAVPDGLQALQWLGENGPPGLVLMDLMMPEVNGWELHTEIQTDPTLSSLPVVVISSADKSRVAPLLPGVAAYLPKPVGLKELVETVKKHIHT